MKVQKKILVAMSHKLQEKQIQSLSVLGFEIVESIKFAELGCNKLNPNLSSIELAEMAVQIVEEAESEKFTAIAMAGEPMLMFHVWNLAKQKALAVMQSTTERKTVEVEQADGTMKKTQIFDHVQWRTL